MIRGVAVGQGGVNNPERYGVEKAGPVLPLAAQKGGDRIGLGASPEVTVPRPEYDI